MKSDRNLSAALEAVQQACRVARRVQTNIALVQRITKDDKSPVTVADYAVQAVVAMSLRNSLGDSLITGEETTGELRSLQQTTVLDAVVAEVQVSRRGVNAQAVLDAIDDCSHDATADTFWALDPIDGTKGFLRGQQYAIALARIEDGQVVLGVMGCPNLPVDHSAPLDQPDSVGVIYSASAGDGAWEFNPHDVTKPRRRIFAGAYDGSRSIRACESVEAAHSKQDDTARILGELGAPGVPARLDSQCKYAVVARGQADAYLRLPTKKGYEERIWDHAAGMVIASEAGAIVSDITGAPLDFAHGRTLKTNRGIVCAAAGLHDRIIEVIDQLGIGAAV